MACCCCKSLHGGCGGVLLVSCSAALVVDAFQFPPERERTLAMVVVGF
jgi:hypothetical protein